MTDQNNQHPFAMTKEQERYFLQKHLGGGQALPRPAGSEMTVEIALEVADKYSEPGAGIGALHAEAYRVLAKQIRILSQNSAVQSQARHERS